MVTAANGATKPHPELIAGYGQLPIYFEANRGQADSQVQFLARGQGYTFLLSPTKAVMALNRPEASERRSVGASRRSHAARSHAPTLPRSDAVNIIHMEFAGASGPSRVVGLEELPGQVNYFIGNDAAQWRRGIPTFAKVKYEQMYPGVDLICYGNQRQLEYDFVLAPGADPSVVSLHFDGVDQLEIDAQGDLILHTSSGNLHQHKPLIYQTEQSLRREIAGGYVLKDSHTAAFQVAAYDCSKPLVIDPVLNYSTYLGGRNLDVGWDIAVDPAGYAYLAGESLSPDLATVSAFQPKYAGGFSDGTNLVGGDAFVAKLDPNGGRVYVTYLGGKGDEAALGIVVDAAGEACVTGYTDSTNFPTWNPIQSVIHGTPDPFFALYPTDGFVAKLDATGSNLLYSTYLGGNGMDEGIDIAVDAAGCMYVTGFTESTNFPVKNALQQFLNTTTNHFGSTFNADAFVAKINPTNAGTNTLIYCTYLGSLGVDEADGIAVDATGCAYVTGVMDLLGQRDLTFSTLYDAFVVKLDPAGSSLVYGQLLHGSSNELPFRVTLDAAGSAYVTGSTDSGDFPTTPNDLNQGGVFKSIDGGATWSRSSAGLSRGFIRSLAVDPTASSNLYAGTAAGVFKSTDGGGSWSNNAGALQFVTISNSITEVTIITTNNTGPVSTNIVFLTNALATPVSFWLTSPNALGFRLVSAIAFDPTDSSRLFAGTAGAGLFTSFTVGLVGPSVTNVAATITNAESIWFPLLPTNGIALNPNINAFVVDPLRPATLYAGTGGGLFKSTNNGGTWAGAGLAFPVIKALAIAPDASVLYAGSSSGIARTSNRGTNWTVVNNGLASLSVNALALDPNSPNTVYAGTDRFNTGSGLFKSVNGGTNWLPLTNLMGSVTYVGTNGVPRTTNFPVSVNTLAIDPSTPTTLYAGTLFGLFKTTNGGVAWNPLTNGLPATNVASLAVDPTSPSTVYAGTGTTNSFGNHNCFVTKISPDGASFAYSTVLGGSGSDQGWDIAVDAGGNAFVTGTTTSTNFPVAQAPSTLQTTNSGGSDAFLFELNPNGSGLAYSFYYGGKGNDSAHGLGMDAAGNVYMIGQTTSTNVPLMNSFQGTNAGGPADAFVAKFGSTAPAKLLIARSGSMLALSWLVLPTEFVLEVNNNGMHPGDWTTVLQTPTVFNGTNALTLPILPGHQTFRLRRR